MARSGSRLALAALPLALAFAASAAPTPAGDQQQPDQQAVTVGNRDRVVVTGMVPIPDVGEGAPRYTSRDLEVLENAFRDTQADVEHDFRTCHTHDYGTCDDASVYGEINSSMSCEREHAIKAANLADKAAAVTREAEEVRRAAMTGQADQAAVEAAELKRQEAVNKVQAQRKKLIDVQANIGVVQKLQLMGRKTIGYIDVAPFVADREKAGWGLGLAQPDLPEGLSISDVKATQRTDRKGDYVLLQGKVNNKLSRSTPVPALQASLVDDRGSPLYVTSVEPDKWNPQVRAHGSYSFGFEIRPAPQAMTHAIVAFATKDNPPPRLSMSLFCSTYFTSGPAPPERSYETTRGSSGMPLATSPANGPIPQPPHMDR